MVMAFDLAERSAVDPELAAGQPEDARDGFWMSAI